MIQEIFKPLWNKKAGGYVAVTLLISWLVEGFIIYRGGFNSMSILWIVILMWTPGIIGLLFRFATKDWADFPVKLGGFKWWIFIPILSFMITGIPFLVSWIFGVNGFVVPNFSDSRWFEIGGVWLAIGIMIPSRIAVQSLFALGEELGWQGYLVPKLIQNGAKKPFLTQAIIWSLWHTPLILFGGYASSKSDFLILSLISYWLMISSFGIMIGRITQKTKSVWLAAIFHGSHNFFIQQWWLMWTIPGTQNWLFTGESGILTAVIFLIALYLINKYYFWLISFSYQSLNSGIS